MRYPKGKRYFSNESALDQYRREVKFVPCPHCGRMGFLIGHGFLFGYAEAGQEIVVRGRRFFCSNRYRRRGCGLTFSVLLADVLVGFVVRTYTLFAFLQGVADGLSRKAAWGRVAGSFSLESGYRLWRRLSEAQTHIKAVLCRQRPPPYSTAAEPLVQVRDHLRYFFPTSDCLFTSFQRRFQTPLLG